ncbi:MAG TPA: ABC transporter permease, partial [Methylomirabilota bacterium]|nr:ABC transporter permease [Methylomirabilota bacterium]
MNGFASLRAFLRHSLLGRAGFAAAALLVLAAVLAPWIAPADPSAQNLPARLSPPDRSHWMGTDELGRDVASRVLHGARVSLFVAVSVVCGCGLTGLAIGALAGYAGGWLDRFTNVILINTFLAFPGVLLAIAFAAFLGPGI